MNPNNPYGPPSGQPPYDPYSPGAGPGPAGPSSSGQPQPYGGYQNQPQSPRMYGYGTAPDPYGQPVRPAAPAPPQPEVPFFLDPNGPYGPLHSTAPPPRKRKKGPVLAIAALVSLVIVIGIIMAFGSKQGAMTADDVFTGAIQHALATKSYTQKTTIGKMSETVQYDLTDSSDPKLNASVKLDDDDLAYTGYGSLKNTYVSFSQTDGKNVSNTMQGKWVQIRKDGKLPDTDDTLKKVAPLTDPQTLLFSLFPRGSFTDTDRQSMLGLIQQKQLYTYDVSAANTSVIGGQAVYVYNVTIHTDGLTELNKKVAGAFGINDSAVSQNAAIGQASAATFYISINDQQLVKMDYKNGDTVVSSDFSDFDTTQITSEPVADLQWSDVAIASAQNKDALRKLQLGSIAVQLESFFAKNKYYPTLANLNDAAWVQTNFSGFDASRLRDPAIADGTAPFAEQAIKGQFAYQVGTDKTLAACTDPATCKYFKLIATLDDGSVFVRESL